MESYSYKKHRGEGGSLSVLVQHPTSDLHPPFFAKRPSDQDGRPERAPRVEGSLFRRNSFNINTYEKCVCNSFNINTYKKGGEGYTHFRLSTVDCQLCAALGLLVTSHGFYALQSPGPLPCGQTNNSGIEVRE